MIYVATKRNETQHDIWIKLLMLFSWVFNVKMIYSAEWLKDSYPTKKNALMSAT